MSSGGGFSPDGRILASASDGTYHGPGAGIIQLWDVTDPARPAAVGRSQHRRARVQLPGVQLPRAHSGQRRPVRRSPAVGRRRSGPPAALSRFRTDTRGLSSVAFTPDGRTLASGDDAGHIRLWNVADPARPAALGPPLSILHSVSSVAFSPDGHTLAASSNGGFESAFFTSAGLFDSPGYIRLWNVSDPAHPPGQARTSLPVRDRPDSARWRSAPMGASWPAAATAAALLGPPAESSCGTFPIQPAQPPSASPLPDDPSPAAGLARSCRSSL